MRKLINHPTHVALESLQGFELAYSQLLRVHYDPDYVVRADAPVRGKVAVVSGSGGGHEPLNIGYVGRGMLDAACPGAVFTSPTPDQYLGAVRAVDGGAGVLFVVKNYMGGVLNTEMAMELAVDDGYEVASVLVNDDVALAENCNRRGMGAAVLVEKMAGAAAEAGYSLTQVAEIAQRTSSRTRSMGVALTSCTAPNVGRPTFVLPEHEVEFGVGIHGEPGQRRAPYTNADQIVGVLVETIVSDLRLAKDDRVLAMVSGLGGTPLQELFIAFRRVHSMLTRRSIKVERQLVGNFITSLDMAGCAVTLLRLDQEMIDLWDAPVRTPTLWW